MKIVVVIENGQLHSVFSKGQKVDVEVIDLDTQDVDAEKFVKKALKKIHADGSMIESY